MSATNTKLFADMRSTRFISNTLAQSARRAFERTGDWTQEEADKIILDLHVLQAEMELQAFIILSKLAGRKST